MMYLSSVHTQVRNFANKFIKNERGVTAIEYAIVAAGVSSVLLVIFGNSAGHPVYDLLNGVFTSLRAKLNGVITSY